MKEICFFEISVSCTRFLEFNVSDLASAPTIPELQHIWPTMQEFINTDLKCKEYYAIYDVPRAPPVFNSYDYGGNIAKRMVTETKDFLPLYNNIPDQHDKKHDFVSKSLQYQAFNIITHHFPGKISDHPRPFSVTIIPVEHFKALMQMDFEDLETGDERKEVLSNIFWLNSIL